MGRQTQIGRLQHEAPARGGHKRDLAQRAGIDSAQQLLHGRVARQGQLINPPSIRSRLFGQLADHFVQGFDNRGLEAL